MLICAFHPHYQLVCANSYISSFSLISYERIARPLRCNRAAIAPQGKTPHGVKRKRRRKKKGEEKALSQGPAAVPAPATGTCRMPVNRRASHGRVVVDETLHLVPVRFADGNEGATKGNAAAVDEIDLASVDNVGAMHTHERVVGQDMVQVFHVE